MAATPEQAVQVKVREIARDLDAIRHRLEEIHRSLPVPGNEALMLLGETDMDVSTELRSVIECVLTDSLRPAIRDLQAAADYRPSAGGED